MAVEFSFTALVDMLAQTVFGGSIEVAGLVIMMCVFFVLIVVMANLGASPIYALVPLIVLDIIFASLGVLNTTVAFLILVISAVVTAVAARGVVGGS